MTSRRLAEKIGTFLPDGYFYEEHEGHGTTAADVGNYLDENYTFKLYGYWRGDSSSSIPTYYGVIVPQKAVLPGGGDGDDWNFRRAARIAMLIGIDGGAYDSDVTDGEVVGSVGTWSLPASDLLDNDVKDIPIYVALTGLDVFTPEVELPALTLGLPSEWDLVTQRLHAFGYFSVGGNDTPRSQPCYGYGSRRAVADASGTLRLESDQVKPAGGDCLPAFWVEPQWDSSEGKEVGHVYVLNDLHIGANPAENAKDSKITLTKTGQIITPNVVMNKDGQMIYKDKTPSDLSAAGGEHYVLDPAYTSIMNDVRLASRGGARLSEILPDYILKSVKEIGGSTAGTTIEAPDCPTGYKKALAVMPSRGHAMDVTGTLSTSGGEDVDVSGGNLDLSEVNVNLTVSKRPAVQIAAGSCRTAATTATPSYKDDHDSDLCVYLGKAEEKGNNFAPDDKMYAIVQTYCVFKAYDTTAKEGVKTTGTSVNRLTAEEECEDAGFTWDNTNLLCKFTYTVEAINSIADSAEKQAACRVANLKWDGSSCEDPSKKDSKKD